MCDAWQGSLHGGAALLETRLVALRTFPKTPVSQHSASSFVSEDGEVLHANFCEVSTCLMLMRAF